MDTARFLRCYEMAKQKEYDVLSKVPCKRLDFDDLLLECWIRATKAQKLVAAIRPGQSQAPGCNDAHWGDAGPVAVPPLGSRRAWGGACLGA